MTDDWKARASASNRGWLKKMEKKYPFQITLPRASGPSLQEVAALPIVHIYAPMLDSDEMVWGFDSAEALALFRKTFNIEGDK